MNKIKRMKCLLIMICTVFIFTPVYAQDSTLKEQRAKETPWFVKRFRLTAGFFVPINNTNIRVGLNNGNAGTDIDFENDLGFNKNVGTFLGNFQWRASRRSRFDFTYYRINRSSDYVLQRDIRFRDHTYNVNAMVSSFFNTSIYRISYGYSIFSRKKYEAGLTIGVHAVRASVGLAASGNNIGGEVSDDFRFTAPIPDLGIWGGYVFSNRVAVNAEFDYLAMTIDNTSGRVIAYNITCSYKILENLDAALGYTGLNFKIDVERERANGHLRWGYNGPSLTVTFSFGRSPWAK